MAAVAGARARAHHARHVGESLQQLAQELGSRPFVAPRLREDVAHGAVLVDGPPQGVVLAGKLIRARIRV